MEKVAKKLADHLIDFKGCTHHMPVIGELITGMGDFIDDRRRLWETIPWFVDPDFVQPDRLPVRARLPCDPGHEVEDEWKKLSSNALWHMTADEWDECHERVRQIFTSGTIATLRMGRRSIDTWILEKAMQCLRIHKEKERWHEAKQL